MLGTDPIPQVLCLALTGQDCTPVHVVASGDTCFDIAAAAGANVTTLLANNPNVDSNCTNIYPGEVRVCLALRGV
jgi:LysM repeat protein